MTTTAPIRTAPYHHGRRRPRPDTDAWRGFAAGPWQDGIDVRDFIQRNYTPYPGDARLPAGRRPSGPPRSGTG